MPFDRPIPRTPSKCPSGQRFDLNRTPEDIVWPSPSTTESHEKASHPNTPDTRKSSSSNIVNPGNDVSRYHISSSSPCPSQLSPPLLKKYTRHGNTPLRTAPPPLQDSRANNANLNTKESTNLDEDVDVESVDGESNVDDLRSSVMDENKEIGTDEDEEIGMDEDEANDLDIDVESVGGESDLERLRSETQSPTGNVELLREAVELSRTAAMLPNSSAVKHQSPQDVLSGPSFTRVVSPLPRRSDSSAPPPISQAAIQSAPDCSESQDINEPGPFSSGVASMSPTRPHHTGHQRDNIPRQIFFSGVSKEDMLQKLLDAYQEMAPAILHDPTAAEGDLLEVLSGGMLSAFTVTLVCIYLATTAVMTRPSSRIDFAIGLPVNLRWGALECQDDSASRNGLTVLGGQFPQTIILPVSDRAATHFYLWYITSTKQGDIYILKTRLFDSLSGGHICDIFLERCTLVGPTVQHLFPGFRLEVQPDFEYHPNFQQEPDSNHCGFYVAWATSAALFNDLLSLEKRISIYVVQLRMAEMLRRCRNGDLEMMLRGSAPDINFLNLHSLTERIPDEAETQPALTTTKLSRQAVFEAEEWQQDKASSDQSEDNIDYGPDRDDSDNDFILDLVQKPQNGTPAARLWAEALMSYQEQDAHGRSARLRYLSLLKKRLICPDTLTVLAGYFWFSAATLIIPYTIVLLDPVTLELMAETDSDYVPETPMGTPLEPSPLLWHRKELWTGLGLDKTLLVLQKAELQPDHMSEWFVLAVHVHGDETSLAAYHSGGWDKTLGQSLIHKLIQLIHKRFPFPLSRNVAFKRIHVPPSVAEHDRQSDHCSGLTALSVVTELLLAREVKPPSIDTFHGSILRFYQADMCGEDLVPTLPWTGLARVDGTVYGHQELQAAPEWRRHSPSLSELGASGEAGVSSQLETPNLSRRAAAAYDMFFLELRRTNQASGEGMLEGIMGRSFDDLERAIFLSRRQHQRPGAHIHRYPSEQNKDNALSIQEFASMFKVQGGPRTDDNSRRILTGLGMDDMPIHLDWLKNTHIMEPDWLVSATDVDSLSLTVREPEICQMISIYPYPSRLMTMNTNNELKAQGSIGQFKHMHQLPNICMGTIGANNQFRLNVFFPDRQEFSRSRWRNFPTAQEYQTFFELILRPAIKHVVDRLPNNLRNAGELILNELPSSYAIAEVRCTTSGGGRTFRSHKISHEIMNMVFPIMRYIVNTDPRLATYRNFYYHLFAINLKQVGGTIRGHCNNNPLLRVFTTFPIVHWQKQNPHDIMIDVGLEITVDKERLTTQLPETTLIWRLAPLKKLLAGTWSIKRLDAFCHSKVVGGFAATPYAHNNHGIVKLQCYMKDKLRTYGHADQSVGANFTSDQAHRGQSKYLSQFEGLQLVLEETKSYGVRMEWRCGPWAAWQILGREPHLWAERLLEEGTLVCHSSKDVSNFKLTLLHAYDAVFRHQTKHRIPRAVNPGADYLAEIVSYLWKGLIQAPDSMSASFKMATATRILQHALQYGYASMSPKHLLENGYEALLEPPVDSEDSEIDEDIAEEIGQGETSRAVRQHGIRREFTPIPSEDESPIASEGNSILSEDSNFSSSDIEEDVPATLPPILQHTKRIRPGGQRFKQSHLLGVPKPKRLLHDRWTDTPNPASRNINRTPLTPPPSSGPALYSSSPDQPLQQSSAWTQEDQEFLKDIFNNHLPRWWWSQFPKAYLRSPEPPQSIQRRRKPLTKARFHQLAAEDAELKELSRSSHGFKNVFDQLFPANFKIKPTQKTTPMVSFEDTCLKPIRRRIRSKSTEQQKQFTSTLRTRIRLELAKWEFLPAIQQRIVWAQTGSGARKPFSVYINPSYVR